MTRQNQIIAAVAAVLIILLGVGGYFFLGKNQTKSVTTQTANTQKATNSGSTAMQSSITDLFTGTATKQCTFDTKSQTGGETKGTVYVADGKAYGDFAITSNGKTSGMFLIRNGSTFYIWGDSLPSGMKMTMDVNEMATKMQGGQYSSFNPSAKVDVNCTNWSVDESKFTPPSNVKFIDAGAMMPKTTTSPTTSGGTADPCASIADATTKAACENAMHNSK